MATSTAKIYINGKEVENTLKALTAEATRLRKELSGMTVGDANFEQTAKGWQQVRQEIEKQKKALNDYLDVFEDVPRVSNSIGSLKDMHRQLLKELEKLEIGTDAWRAKMEKVSDVEGKLAAVNKEIEEINKKKLLENAPRIAENSIIRLKERHTDLKKELENLEIGSEEWLKKLDKVRDVEGKLAAVNRELKGVSDKKGIFEQIFAVFIGGGLLDIVEGAVGQIRNLGESALKASSDAEMLTIALETMLGSKEKAEKLKAEIIDLVAKSPLELEQANEVSKRLLAMGFEAEQIVPTLKMLGNIASGVGIEKLPQLTLALGQVKAATKLTGNELRQFTEAGVPLLDELSKIMKKPVAEIQKMVSDGKIGYAQVEQAMRNMTTEGGRFNNLMEKQSQTLQGQWSTFKDNFTQNVLIPLGNALSEMAKPLIRFGSYLLENIPTIQYWATVVGAVGATILSYVAGVKLAALWTEIQTKRQVVLSSVTAAWNTIVGVLTGRIALTTLAQQAWNLALRLNPIGLVITAIAALTTALVVYKNTVSQAVKNQELLNNVNNEAAQKTVEQKLKLQQLLDVAKDEKRSKEERIKAIKALNALSPEYLGNLSLEKIGTQEATAAVNKYISALDKKAKAEAAQSMRTALEKRKMELEQTGVGSDVSYMQMAGNVFNTLAKTGSLQKYDEFNAKTGVENAKKIREGIESEIAALEKYINDNQISFIETDNTNKGGGGGTTTETDKKVDKEREALNKLRELLVTYQNDIDQLNANHDEAEALKIEEKYAKQIKAAQELFKSKDPKVRKEAAEIVAALLQKQHDEILAVGNKHYNDLLAQTKKREQDIAEAKLSAEEKKISDIQQSYAKQLEEARQLEQSKLPEIAQKGLELRLQIEQNMNAEIAQAREKARIERAMEAAKQTVKDNEETDAFWQKQAQMKAEYNALMKELQPENKVEEGDSIEVKLAKMKAQNDAEIAELDRKVKAQRKILGDDAENVQALNKAFEAKKTEIANKGALERIKIQADELGKTLSKYAELTNNIGNAFKALGDIIGSETEEAAALQKIAGMAKIMVDTATAISGIVSVAATTSLDPITMAIRISAGVATVLTNIAAAKKLLFGAPEVKQKVEGGYSVRGKDDGRVYNAQYIGARSTGMLPPTPSLVLASEKGAEYYVSAPALTRPDVAWHVRMIDNIMNNRSASMPIVAQKVQGGYTEGGSGNDSVMMLVLDVVGRLNDTLDRGIDARTTIGYEQVRDISKAQERLSSQ